ncbi:MAG: N-6 DNA methylase [Angelakisella sp.]|jgi:hypothetical protein|nr:N-6 DNA methylase [Angelakisella sp.]
MEERRADLQRAEEKESAEVSSEKVRALFIDLYNYFRMDSGVDPIVLFEQLCCLLIQLSDDGLEFDGAPDPVSSYRALMDRCKEWDRWGISDSAAFADRPKLAGRMLDTAHTAWELIRNRKQLVPPLFDLLETILRDRPNAALGTPFRTAREIVKLAGGANQIMLFPTVLDPACGSGAFLVAALEQMDKKDLSYSGDILGLERDRHLRNAANLLVRLYDQPHAVIEVLDGGIPVEIGEGTYNFILANPPFRSQSLRDREMIDDTRSLPISTKDVHRAFLQRILLGLGAGGVSAIIVPDSFLSHTASDAIRVRRWILERFRCKGIVKLPAYTFYPQSMVRASVLFLRRPWNPQSRILRDGIFFFSVTKDGRSDDSRRLPVAENDFDELGQVWNRQDALWQEWRGGPRSKNVYGMDVPADWNHPHFWFGSLEDIARNDFVLLPDRYQPVKLAGEPTEKPREILGEMLKLGEEMLALTRQLAEAEYGR